MVIQAVCGSGLGSSLLVAMNVKQVLKQLNVPYQSVEHTNVGSFIAQGVDWVVCGRDVAPVIDFPESQKIILLNILSIDELTKKLKSALQIA